MGVARVDNIGSMVPFGAAGQLSGQEDHWLYLVQTASLHIKQHMQAGLITQQFPRQEGNVLSSQRGYTNSMASIEPAAKSELLCMSYLFML